MKRAGTSAGPPQAVQQRLGVGPGDAGVGDRHARLQRHAVFQILPAFVQMAFNHQPDDAVLTVSQLPGNVSGHVDLAAVLLGRVGV